MGVGVGMSRRGAAAAIRKDKGGDYRSKRDRRRRTDTMIGLEGMGGMGGSEDLHCRSFDRGVSPHFSRSSEVYFS